MNLCNGCRLSAEGELASAMKQLHLSGSDASGSSAGGAMTADDFGKSKTATHTGVHYLRR